MNALWFQAIDFRHSTIKAAHAKTCEWLLERPEYLGWLDIKKISDHHGLLWVKGKPGSGKSTLVKFVAADVRKTRKEAVVISFFFNARGEDLEKSTLGMYRSLVFQLLKALPDLQGVLDLRPNVLRNGDSCTWVIEDLQHIFEAAVQRLEQRHLICFIDALDECKEDQIRDLVVFIEKLGQLALEYKIHFNVFLSSRPYPHVSVAKGTQLVLHKQEGHVQDIVKYINSKLKAGRGNQIEAIKEEIQKRASGIFLWVALVVQILNKEFDHGRIHALRRRLREIPDGLDKLFGDILTRDGENLSDLILCLQWVLYAKRPLKREELYYAILSGAEIEALGVSSSEATTAEDMERFILSCSKGLAETTKLKVQTVQFIHESVRDFLLGKSGLNKLKSNLEPGQSQERLKQCCYNYMKTDVSEYLPSHMPLPAASSAEAKDLRELFSKKFPFLEYAVHSVLFHANNADGHGISQDEFVEEFAIGDWIMLDNLFERYQVRRHTPQASLLYIFAERSLSNLIRTQLKRDLDPDTAAERFENERHGAPLYAALAYSKVCEDTIRALIIPKIRTSRDYGELQNAGSDSEFDCYRAAVEALTKCGNIHARKGQNLLSWVASQGYEDVVRLQLAKSNIDLGGRDKDGQTPLSLAASNGHEPVVKLLVANKNVDPNSKDLTYGQTPLSWAAKEGHEPVVKLLLANKNVDRNSKDLRGRTPLSWAAEKDHEAVVKLLACREC